MFLSYPSKWYMMSICSFIQSFICISMDTWISLKEKWFTICYYHSLFLGSNCPKLASGSPVNLGLFDMPPSFFEHFLTCWNNKIFKAYVVFFQSMPGNQPFFQGDLVHLSGEWKLEAKIRKMGVPIVTGTLLLPGPQGGQN